MKNVLTLIFLVFYFYPGLAQGPWSIQNSDEKDWVDSVYHTLNSDEKIGQLFMVAAYSNRDKAHLREIMELVTEYHIGGLIFFQGGPVRQVQMTNRFQKAADVPLLIGMDLEWGLGMRLDSTISFPRQMVLGANPDTKLIYQMGAEIARQSKLIGVHMNFAPVVDVNNNADNPVIGTRSFGENVEQVTLKSLEYMKGMQDNGLIACAKHFPGHGDTDADSHHTLPVIRHDRDRLDSLELVPYRELIAQGLQSIMIAHLNVPSIDKTENLPTTLSRKAVQKLLKEELNFQGLVITDALNMKGVTANYAPGEADLMAFEAGNDILLFPENVPLAIRKIKKSIRRDKNLRKELDEKVRKILLAKYRAGLNHFQPINTDNLVLKLNRPDGITLHDQLFKGAATLVRDQNAVVPLEILDTLNIACLSIGKGQATVFNETLSAYARITYFKKEEVSVDRLAKYDIVIAGVTGMHNGRKSKYNLDLEDVEFLKALDKRTSLITVVMGNPYSLSYFEELKTVICTYVQNEITERTGAEIIFGTHKTKGKLPVSASKYIKEGMGLYNRPLNRLGFGSPSEVGVDAHELERIDHLAMESIETGATPGCRILIARKGKIFYDKSFGHYTYDSIRTVNPHTIYDIASITKVAATVPLVMFLVENRLLDMKATLKDYLPELKGTNKENIVIHDMLTHQAGLLPYIPYYSLTLGEDGELDSLLYSPFMNTVFKNQIAPDIYVNDAVRDSIWHWSVTSDLRKKEPGLEEAPYDYKYSDMGFYFMIKIAERLLNQPVDDFLYQNIYEPMGFSSMTYNPLCYFPAEDIVPTEKDDYFRNQLISGFVHDPGAAMYGGVAGHAGVFSNAYDLGAFMQMMLQKGNYGGQYYFLPQTVDYFTRKQNEENRRGIIWDKPDYDIFNGPTGAFASPSTFGHSGFTGTATWADPEFDLVYVFLSNRVYPKSTNTKLIKNNVRTRIQDIIYESIFSYQKTHAE